MVPDWVWVALSSSPRVAPPHLGQLVLPQLRCVLYAFHLCQDSCYLAVAGVTDLVRPGRDCCDWWKPAAVRADFDVGGHSWPGCVSRPANSLLP